MRLPLIMQREWAQQCHEMIGSSVPESDELTLSKTPNLVSHLRPCHQFALENIPVIKLSAPRGRCKEWQSTISKPIR